ncbi:small conductance mechanosensitive channel [Flavobacterium endophyticum]|uniref:Small conductance mechanosensitive channel n=1 Tax=Flavobacterium endophyticum TaxID=1540163 RepID=A0A495MLG2_9FLAO|nr:mechanosensitive ion channel domain-containing protein [Flavobacterium endophyticum]RKS25912.1 small conductance mechanosensitive channel [Flavobacterium endophyticum]
MLIDTQKIETYTDRFIAVLVDYSPRLIGAFLILFLGLWGIRLLNRLATKIMISRNLEPTLTTFLANILIWVLRVLLFVIFISKLGVETSSFVAILGAAGLAVGLSLQGSLSNFAGGVLIILFKPFKVGDTIEAQAETAKVLEIQIFTTKLLTASNQVVYIPNGILSNNKIKNFSQNNSRRADLVFKINYETDIKQVKDMLIEIMKKHPQVLKNPAPAVIVSDLTDTGINLVARPWSKNENFGNMSSDILEQSLAELEKMEKSPFVKAST